MFTENYPRVPLKLMGPHALAIELGTVMSQQHPSSRELISSAAAIAAFAHEGQTRKYRDGAPRTPYIEHPLRVTLRMARWGVTNPDSLAAALMHDVVEDSADRVLTQFAPNGRTGDDRSDALAFLRASYGPEVVGMVAAVTNDPSSSVGYADKIAGLARRGSASAVLIKVSDMCDNAGSLIHQYGHVEDRFVTKLGAKYTPLLPVLADSIDARWPKSKTMATAADHARRISDKVTEMLAEIEAKNGPEL